MADVYDALTTKRIYKPAYTHERTRSIILDGRGSHLDPEIVEAFLRRETDFLDVYHRFREDHSPSEQEEMCVLSAV